MSFRDILEEHNDILNMETDSPKVQYIENYYINHPEKYTRTKIEQIGTLKRREIEHVQRHIENSRRYRQGVALGLFNPFKGEIKRPHVRERPLPAPSPKRKRERIRRIQIKEYRRWLWYRSRRTGEYRRKRVIVKAHKRSFRPKEKAR
jgi:hypothetical protein